MKINNTRKIGKKGHLRRVFVTAFEPSTRPKLAFFLAKNPQHLFCQFTEISAIVFHMCVRAFVHSSRWLARFSFARKVTMFTREALRVNFFRVFRQREHKAIRRPAQDIIFAWSLLSNGNHFRLLPPSKRRGH